MRRHSSLHTCVVALAILTSSLVGAQELRLPNAEDSVKFAVIGDNGNGSAEQFAIGALMARYRHDNQGNRFYKPWNMGGERYYSHKKKNVRFFVLDSAYLDQKQRDWIERELKTSTDDWKIVYFHHPLYSSGGRQGSEVDLRIILEPLFLKYGVNVVFSGHDHIYERLKPQKGVYYFVEGSSGQLRPGDLRRTPLTEVGNDQDQTFMLVEIDGDVLAFQAITRSGKTIDSGVIRRQPPPKGPPTATRD